MKLAYFVRPHLGGTFSVFLNLRRGLRQHGIDVQWVAATPPDSAGVAPEGGFFALTAALTSDEMRARALVERLELEAFDGVFINVLAEQLQMNLARYLPQDLLRIMIVHSITPATYAAAMSIRDNVHATVAVSDRAHRDLVARYGFSPGSTSTIHNAIDVSAFSGMRKPDDHPLRLLFLGRVEDISKGVFWLPKIMANVPSSVTLTVAGNGPDLPALKDGLAPFGNRVTCLGAVGQERVPHLLAEHDVLLMPSRFEGSPVTLMEAMAAGCVPVASQIASVTDNVIAHGVSGLLFPVGDWRQAAREISGLYGNGARLQHMSTNARRYAADNFGLERMSDAYATLFRNLRAKPPSIAEPLPLDQWNTPGGFRPGLRAFLPRSAKNWLRVARERFA